MLLLHLETLTPALVPALLNALKKLLHKITIQILDYRHNQINRIIVMVKAALTYTLLPVAQLI